MKGTRSTLVLLGVLVALGAYIYFVELERLPASETLPNEQLFGTMDADDIQTVVIRGSDGQTSLERRGPAADGEATWQVTDPIDTRADAVEVSTVIASLASVEIRRVVEEGPIADLAPFGLAEPNVEIVFTISDSDVERTLLIGEATPTGADRYAKLGGDDRILLVEEGLESSFDKSTFRLRDKSILDIDTTTVDTLRVETDATTVALSKRDSEWHVVEPWNARGDFSLIEGLVGRLGNGEVLSIAAEGIDEPRSDDDSDTDPYGLEAPSATVTLGAGSATATLLIGNVAATGGRHARDASRPVVFTVDEALADDLTQDAGNLRRKDLFTFRSFNATRLEIDQPGLDVVFEKEAPSLEDDAEDDAAPSDGSDVWVQTAPERLVVVPSEMDDLLSQISNLRGESFVASRSDAGVEDANILATIRVTYGSDEEITERVVMWRIDDNTYAVPGDEPGAAVVNTRAIDDAFDALDTVRQLVGDESEDES